MINNNNKEEYIIVKIFKGKIMGNTGHVYPNKEIAEINRNNYQNGIEKLGITNVKYKIVKKV